MIVENKKKPENLKLSLKLWKTIYTQDNHDRKENCKYRFDYVNPVRMIAVSHKNRATSGKKQHLKITSQENARYWTGTSLQPRLMQGVFSNAHVVIYLFLMILPRTSFHSKLFPVKMSVGNEAVECALHQVCKSKIILPLNISLYVIGKAGRFV